MHEELRGLHERAGRPSKDALKRNADRAGHSVATSTLIGLPTGHGRPRWATVEAFIDACLRYADGRPHTLVESDHDMARWRARYDEAYPAGRRAREPDDDLLEAYRERLLNRYGRLDIAAVLPLDGQDQPAHIELREVFVVPAVRPDPPPVELPRELWQRRAAPGAAGARDLPAGLDREALLRAHRVYEQRTPRPVLDVLAEPAGRRSVVLGDPGSGKSTLARFLAVALARDPRADLPVLVELRSYAEPRWRDGTFLDYLDHQYRGTDERLGLPRELLERRLGSGRVLVVFDGLDELFDLGDRERVTHRIAGFAARYPRVRVLVTSRRVGYVRGALDAAGFVHHLLQDLDRDRIAAFTDRWYRAALLDATSTPGGLADRLLAAIDDSPAVRELAGNPLLLTILAAIGRRGELPRDRRRVYEHAVTVLVEHWEVGKHLAAAGPGLPQLDQEDKLELLRLVARRLQDSRAGLAGNHIAGPALLDMFRAYLQESHGLPPGPARVAARAMVEQFRHRNFILSRFGGEVYGFVHRAFLEYFAAADIDLRFGKGELSGDDLVAGVFGRRWKDPAWHEVLLLLIGMREDLAGRVVERLLAADPLWSLRPRVVPHHILLAVRCLGEIRMPGALKGQNTALARALTDLLETLNELSFDPGVMDAVGQAVLPALSVAGPDWPGRDHYLAWYRVRGHEAHQQFFPQYSVIPLAVRIAAVLDPSEPFRRHLRVVAALGPDVNVRIAVVQALAAVEAGDPGTLAWLRRLATGDPSERLRRAAVQEVAGGWAGDPDVRPWLYERIADTHGAVRAAAVEAIASRWPGDPGLDSWLRERAADGDPAVRGAAVRAIGTVEAGNPDTLVWLRDDVAADDEEAVREAAVEAVAAGWATEPGTLAWLRERAANDPGHLSNAGRAAVRAIAAGWPADPGVFAWLRERAVDDPRAFVRLDAMEAVVAAWTGEPDARDWLRERATADPDGTVRYHALRAVVSGWLDDHATLPWLRRRAVEDDDEYARRIAVETVASGWPDRPETLSWLRERATADDGMFGYARRAALEAMAAGWTGDSSVLPLLRVRAVLDDNEDVRAAAVRAIAAGWSGTGDNLALLRDRGEKDPEENVRRDAVRAVARGRPDDPGTFTWLCRRGDDDPGPFSIVRSEVVRLVADRWHDRRGTPHWLHRRLVVDRDALTRSDVLWTIAFGWPEDAGSRPLLVERAVRDPDEEVRKSALHAVAVGWPGHPGTQPLLDDRAALDPHESVRKFAEQVAGLVRSWS
ncbi:NACHT domain-containing protein [Actinoplanes sp. CA-030573]|uniref:NACHT domain-containing protein n=1 Tax=Actinoplanes sp. CA-030573 TaxID=3239898 RepID=UPI003D928CD9